MNASVLAFDTLICLSIVLNLLILAPAILSRNVQRSKAWYGQMLPWLLYSLAYILLLGHQKPEVKSESKPSLLCLLQTILIYAVPPLCGTATLCFVIDLIVILSYHCEGNEKSKPHVQFLLLILPWAVFFGILAEVSFLVAFLNEGIALVQPGIGFYYCHFTSPIPSVVSAVIVVSEAVILVAVQIRIYFIITRRRSKLIDCHFLFSLAKRSALLSVMLLAAVLTGVFVSTSPTTSFDPATWNIPLAIMPILAALAFGTQKDIINTWVGWMQVATHQIWPPTALPSLIRRIITKK